MPAKVRRNKSGGFSVRTPNQVHAKNTTKTKAKAQARLLNAIDHGFKPDKKFDRAHGEFILKRAKANGVEVP